MLDNTSKSLCLENIETLLLLNKIDDHYRFEAQSDRDRHQRAFGVPWNSTQPEKWGYGMIHPRTFTTNEKVTSDYKLLELEKAEELYIREVDGRTIAVGRDHAETNHASRRWRSSTRRPWARRRR